MPFPLVPIIAAGASIAGGIIGQRKQRRHNLELAKFQASANERYLAQMNEYNKPKNQMARFQEAGLNPHLIYGQGSSGNQSQPLQHPDITPTDMGQLMQLVPQVSQGAVAASQVQAQNAQTRRTGVLTQVDQLKGAVLRKNPLLNDKAFDAIIQGLVATAESKTADASIQKMTADWFTGEEEWTNWDGTKVSGPPGAYKLQREIDLLDQRFALSKADAKIKAQILESKEFQNAILEVQKKWMVDGEITPQLIYQAIMMILMKFSF